MGRSDYDSRDRKGDGYGGGYGHPSYDGGYRDMHGMEGGRGGGGVRPVPSFGAITSSRPARCPHVARLSSAPTPSSQQRRGGG